MTHTHTDMCIHAHSHIAVTYEYLEDAHIASNFFGSMLDPFCTSSFTEKVCLLDFKT